MSYSLATLWYERQRYLPGVLAVGFSALLIALQSGLLLGLFSITSIPIDRSLADVWVGQPKVESVGDTAEIGSRRVRVVGTVKGLKSIAGPYVFCSLETAHTLLRLPPGQATFLLAKCQSAEDARAVVRHVQSHTDKIAAFTRDE